MSENRLFDYLDDDIEIILTGDIISISKELGTTGIVNKDCINIYIDNEDQTVSYVNHRKKKLIRYMNNSSHMKHRKYILIDLLTKDKLKIQAMMSLGFSFEDTLYELYIKDKEPILHSYI